MADEAPVNCSGRQLAVSQSEQEYQAQQEQTYQAEQGRAFAGFANQAALDFQTNMGVQQSMPGFASLPPGVKEAEAVYYTWTQYNICLAGGADVSECSDIVANPGVADIQSYLRHGGSVGALDLLASVGHSYVDLLAGKLNVHNLIGVAALGVGIYAGSRLGSEGEGATGGLSEGEIVASLPESEQASFISGSLKEGSLFEGCFVGGQSFTATTRVELADGTSIPIDQIRIGDKVLATNPNTGKTQAQAVTAVWVNHDTDLLDLTVQSPAGKSVIHTTQHHLFYDPSAHGWTEADQLKTGDRLYMTGGTIATVLGAVVVSGANDMWDLTVNNDHDFYVVVSAGAVLVHNIDCDTLFSTGQAVDRNGYTTVGRAFQKHYFRGGFNPPTAVGFSGATQVPNVLNALGEETLADILTDPRTAIQAYGNREDYLLPWGGARFTNGTFTGFLNP